MEGIVELGLYGMDGSEVEGMKVRTLSGREEGKVLRWGS